VPVAGEDIGPVLQDGVRQPGVALVSGKLSGEPRLSLQKSRNSPTPNNAYTCAPVSANRFIHRPRRSPVIVSKPLRGPRPLLATLPARQPRCARDSAPPAR
jgi:hypothetical protein